MTSENNQNIKEQADRTIRQYQEELQELIDQDLFLDLTNTELKTEIERIQDSYSCSQLKPHNTDKKENLLTILNEINRTSIILYKQLEEILELREEISEPKRINELLKINEQ